MQIIIGIDPSLTSTGIVVLQNGKVETAVTTKDQPELGTIIRVREIIKRIYKSITDLSNEEGCRDPNLIVIEGFSLGSKGNSIFETAYLGWRIREELEQLKLQKLPWIEVTPTQLKKFATGKGMGKKELILLQVYKRWGVEFSDNNQADAFILAKIGEAYLNGMEGLTSFQAEVICELQGGKVKKVKKKVAKVNG